MRVQIELRIHVALRAQRGIELVQETPLELARLDLELFASGAIDDANRSAGMADSVAQLGTKVLLDLLAAEVLDARQNAPNQNFGAALRKKRRTLRDSITGIAFAQMHLAGASIVTGGGQQQLFAERPEAQQSDAELALQSLRALRFQAALDGVADVCRHIVKIRLAIGVFAHTLTIVLDAQVMLSLLLASRDDDRLRLRIDAVLDELCDRFQRVALRQRDNRDRVPVIADAQIAAGARLGSGSSFNVK